MLGDKRIIFSQLILIKNPSYEKRNWDLFFNYKIPQVTSTWGCVCMGIFLPAD